MIQSNIKIIGATDVGQERDHNEDAYIISTDLSDINSWREEDYQPFFDLDLGSFGALLVVADGLGGVNSGEVASATAIQSIKSFFGNITIKETKTEKTVQTYLKNAINHANKEIIRHGKENPETQGMGTTIVVAWIIRDEVHVAWVGDSRAYLYRQGEGLSQISMDHSLVQELINKGEITEEQAFYHPNNNIITQSLGDDRNGIRPECKMKRLKEGDYVLLCSDGLNGMLTDDEIQRILEMNYGQEEKCADILIKAANAAGGNDNITLALGGIDKISIVPDTLENAAATSVVQAGTALVATPEVVEEVGKKRSWGIIIGATLFFLAMAVGGYFLYNYYNENDVNETSIVEPIVDSTKTENKVVAPTRNEPAQEEDEVRNRRKAEETKNKSRDNTPKSEPNPTPKTQESDIPSETDSSERLNENSKEERERILREKIDINKEALKDLSKSKSKTDKEILELFVKDVNDNFLLSLQDNDQGKLRKYTTKLKNSSSFDKNSCTCLRDLRLEMQTIRGYYNSANNKKIHQEYAEKVEILINKECKNKGIINLKHNKGNNINKENMNGATVEELAYNEGKLIATIRYTYDRNVIRDFTINIIAPCRSLAAKPKVTDIVSSSDGITVKYYFDNCPLTHNGGGESLSNIEFQINSIPNGMEKEEGRINLIYF